MTLTLTGKRNGAELSQHDTANGLLFQISQPHARMGIVDDPLDRFGSVPLDDTNRLVILLQQPKRVVVGLDN
ncbi:MAG: hypothetical protein M3Z23_13150 [Acidobacteriota bacterium]|nr:hypothetical protein [Acidobacteriota bacterium]